MTLKKLFNYVLLKANTNLFLFLAPITLLALSPRQALSQEDKNLQLQVGESVSVYSEKAYRKDGGTIFEAIGNVVILSGKETLYGEKASFNIPEGRVEMEGNVRFISEDITIYGSRIVFNSVSGQLEVENARIITSDFNISAESLVKQGPELYYAKKAEFTTCKDCAESWSIFGEEIYIELNEYVKVYHALAKVKGIQILYLPFIALPIKTKRESGLLFPRLLSRVNEGVSFQQPLFWAISEDKDLTLAPSFWGKRGHGADAQYRQAFSEKSWFEYNHRLLEDKIYEPYKGTFDKSLSDDSFSRHFYEVEAHTQWTNNLTQHFVATGTRDLDMFRDFTEYTDDYLLESSAGFRGFLENRFMNYTLGVEAEYRRNLLVSDPTEFDKTYVQTLPSVYLNVMPQTIVHSDKLFLQNIAIGMESDYTVFKQMNRSEDQYLRNAGRFNASPYLHWHFLNYGPISLSSNYTQFIQHYDFLNNDEKYFSKTAGFMRTELSFSMDRIFGLAFEERVSVDDLDTKDLKEVFPDKKNKKKREDLIGDIPDFEESLTEDTLTIVKNSYRHSQEYKFVHHYIANSEERGNERFREQINSSEGWFDYDDAILEDQAGLGSNATRTIIPRKNTVEFQWNNLLIRKSPKRFNYFQDQRYLRDNFNYRRVGFFKLSQGVIVDNEDDDASFNDNLTRLYIHTGYNAATWSLSFSDYYFHQSADQIAALNFQKRFGQVFNGLFAYSANSLPGSDLRTIKAGGQLRPVDTIGFSTVTEYDLDAEENIRTIYQADLMPNNNCWILNFSYRESLNDQRYAFNFVFNLGNDEFKDYRSNYFSFNRLR